MRGARLVVGWVVFLAGLVWFLQGVRVIPGSFMTGSTRWAIIGAILMIVGAATLVLAARHGAPPHRAP
jgi:hypothetical protein